jgi:hypothetical protein
MSSYGNDHGGEDALIAQMRKHFVAGNSKESTIFKLSYAKIILQAVWFCPQWSRELPLFDYAEERTWQQSGQLSVPDLPARMHPLGWNVASRMSLTLTQAVN